MVLLECHRTFCVSMQLSEYITEAEHLRIKRRCTVFIMRFDLSMIIDRLLDKSDRVLISLLVTFCLVMNAIIGDD